MTEALKFEFETMFNRPALDVKVIEVQAFRDGWVAVSGELLVLLGLEEDYKDAVPEHWTHSKVAPGFLYRVQSYSTSYPPSPGDVHPREEFWARLNDELDKYLHG